ncbi:MAG: hypothetical protein EBV15_10950, partial [Bacteroidetes bacterium]|nr:hypothetical protein [Bacteroidota bacterium]
MSQKIIRLELLSLLLFCFLMPFYPLKSELSPKKLQKKTYRKNFYGTIGNLGIRMTLNINEKSNGNVSYTG